MDIVFFYQIVAAVCVGNFISAVFYWGALKAHKVQRDGGSERDIPIKALVALAAPPLFIAGMAWLTTT